MIGTVAMFVVDCKKIEIDFLLLKIAYYEIRKQSLFQIMNDDIFSLTFRNKREHLKGYKK